MDVAANNLAVDTTARTRNVHSRTAGATKGEGPVANGSFLTATLLSSKLEGASLAGLLQGLDEEEAQAFQEELTRLKVESRSRLTKGASSPLRHARSVAQLTQTQLARLSGVDQPNISAIENLKRAMSPKIAKRLAPVLGVNWKTLLE